MIDTCGNKQKADDAKRAALIRKQLALLREMKLLIGTFKSVEVLQVATTAFIDIMINMMIETEEAEL